MNGVHDLGGMMGFGPVVPEANEPFFHAHWEKRSLAMNIAMGPPGGSGGDRGRFARESLPQTSYLAMSYYEIWYEALVRQLIANGFINQAEIDVGHMLEPAKPIPRIVKPEDVEPMLANGRSVLRTIQAPARFRVGDLVRARNIHPKCHTRLPRYIRGRIGVITRVHGAHVFPDSNAAGVGENPQWLYAVLFTGRQLWGDDADPDTSVSVDAWEPYLEGAH